MAIHYLRASCSLKSGGTGGEVRDVNPPLGSQAHRCPCPDLKKASTILTTESRVNSLGARKKDLLRAMFGPSSSLELREDHLHILRSQVFVIIIVDLHHWSVNASAEALNLAQGEKLIGSCLASLYI